MESKPQENVFLFFLERLKTEMMDKRLHYVTEANGTKASWDVMSGLEKVTDSVRKKAKFWIKEYY